jgi:hypothetical protein
VIARRPYLYWRVNRYRIACRWFDLFRLCRWSWVAKVESGAMVLLLGRIGLIYWWRGAQR